MRYHLGADGAALGWRAGLVVPAFIQTFDTDPASAQPLLEALLAAERLQRIGPREAQLVGYAVGHLHDAYALETTYALLFADLNISDEQQPLGPTNVGLNMSMGMRQMLDLARGAPAQRFAGYLEEHPAAAARSFCRVVGATRWARGHGRPIKIGFGAHVCTLRRDSSNVWDGAGHEHDDWHIMAVAFEARLRAELIAGRTDVFLTALAEIVAHGTNLYFWRILLRTGGLHAETAHAVLPFVAQRKTLLLIELGAPIAKKYWF